VRQARRKSPHSAAIFGTAFQEGIIAREGREDAKRSQ
jgi:hypothetical protein